MNNLVIYRSSAGSGKTYTLVKEYLKLILRNPSDYRRILAVTFTNKATEEMKTRVVKAIDLISRDDECPLAVSLRMDGLTFDIKSQAQIALSKILHDYSNFAVTTIDSFFHRIIRAFAKELDLPIGYDIEIDEDIVLEDVINRLVSKIGIDPELTDYLVAYTLHYIESDRGWNIELDIKKLGKELFKERYYELRDQTIKSDPTRSSVKDFIKELSAVMQKFEGDMLAFSEQAQVLMDEYELSIEDLAYGRSGIGNYIINNIGKGKNYTPGKRVYDALIDPTKWATKASKLRPQIMNAVNGGLQQVLTDAVTYYEANLKRYFTAVELSKTIYIKGILNDLLEDIKDYRDENNVFLMSDTNSILRSVINESDAPFIYEKAGNRYDHFLIDEFQDTSTYQWYNLLPLIANCLSSGNYAMIVGDVKQSIYRFRGGNMNLLLADLKTDLAAFDKLMKEENLSTNYRSSKDIVLFNNEFFKQAPETLVAKCRGGDAEIITRTYEDSWQEQIKEGGYVNITFTNADQAPAEKDEDPDDEFIPNKEKALRKLYGHVISCLKDGYSLKDIMILVRYNWEATEAAAYLFSKNIKVISSESLQLNSSAKIQFIVNLLRYISDPGNKIARSQLLYYYLKEIKPPVSGDPGIVVGTNAQPSLFETFEPVVQPQFISGHEIFTDYMKENDTLFDTLLPEEFIKHLYSLRKYSLYEITEELVRIFKLNENPDAFIQRFQDMLLEYTAKHNDDVVTFLSWWEENNKKYNVIVPAGEDALYILTLHKAKGLEKPIIIMPFADWYLLDTKSYIWAGTDAEPFNRQSPFLLKPVKDLEKTYFAEDKFIEEIRSYTDNLNLLYVAFTRASERLYIIIPQHSEYSTGGLIHATISSHIDFNTKYKPVEGIFEYGKASKKASSGDEEEANLYNIDKFISTDWHSKLIIRSRPEELFNSGGNISNLVCEALKRLPSIDKLDETINIMLAEGLVNTSSAVAVKQKLAELLGNKEIEPLFANSENVKAEILSAEGHELKPGRLIIKDNTATAVEFGNEDKNKKRMRYFESTLKSMGFKKINKVFLDIENNNITA